jgi:hypothetical protein
MWQAERSVVAVQARLRREQAAWHERLLLSCLPCLASHGAGILEFAFV